MGVRYQLMAPSIHKIVNYAPEESWILFKSKRSYVQNKVIPALFEQLRHLYVRQHNSFVSTPNVKCKYAKKFRIRVYNFWKYRLDQGRICGRSCYTRRDHILPILFKFEFNTQPTFRGILQISCSIIRLFSS